MTIARAPPNVGSPESYGEIGGHIFIRLGAAAATLGEHDQQHAGRGVVGGPLDRGGISGLDPRSTRRTSQFTITGTAECKGLCMARLTPASGHHRLSSRVACRAGCNMATPLHAGKRQVEDTEPLSEMFLAGGAEVRNSERRIVDARAVNMLSSRRCASPGWKPRSASFAATSKCCCWRSSSSRSPAPAATRIRFAVDFARPGF
jgi:hypothetical protein